MKIAIDARYLSSEPSGIGRYSEGLLRGLACLRAQHEYVVFVRDSYTPPSGLPPNFKFRPVPFAPLSLATLFSMGARIDAEGCDLAHITFPVVPLRMKTPFLVTFHDWQPLTVPGFSSGRPWPIPQLYTRFYAWAYPRAARFARAILADSEYTRAETLRRVPEAAGKCSVAHLAADESLLAAARASDAASSVAAAPAQAPQSASLRNLPPRFILYVGSTRPNKNLPALLRAFASLRETCSYSSSPPALVLALAKERFFSGIDRLIGSLGLRDSVRIIENAHEAELAALYSRAALLSMATTDEGFGLPALEAMALGCPVVIARSGSLPEITAGAALEVPPGDPAALAAAFEKILGDPALADSLRAKGRARAANFSWDGCARATLAAYESAAAGAK